MRLAQTILICVWALLFCLPLHAEPANVLVGEFTFNRPADWLWESGATKSKALTRFIIPDESGKVSGTDVRFYLGQKNPAMAADVWKSYFPGLKEGDTWQEKKKIGKHDLTYISISGSYVFGGMKPKPNHTFFGVVIPSGNDFVHVRILGPKSDVQRASAQFKKMVEDAAKEAE